MKAQLYMAGGEPVNFQAAVQPRYYFSNLMRGPMGYAILGRLPTSLPSAHLDDHKPALLK